MSVAVPSTAPAFLSVRAVTELARTMRHLDDPAATVEETDLEDRSMDIFEVISELEAASAVITALTAAMAFPIGRVSAEVPALTE